MHATELRTGRSGINLLLAIAGLTGIAVPFLPFTDGFWGTVSPVGAVTETDNDLWMLGAPFFLALLISAATVRMLIWGPLSLAEQALAYVAAAAVTGIAGLFLAPALADLHSVSDVIEISIPVAMILMGVALVIRNCSPVHRRSANAVMALQLAYLPNCFLSLLVVRQPGWHVGAWLALATAAIYVADIAWSSMPFGRRSSSD